MCLQKSNKFKQWTEQIAHAGSKLLKKAVFWAIESSINHDLTNGEKPIMPHNNYCREKEQTRQ